ncbi:MAG: hypothetical protein RLZZ116_1470 [Planctomycetota bacterium]|jgi:hypothetical protein
MPEDAAANAPEPEPRRSRLWLRIAGFVLGLACLLSAISVARDAREQFDAALASLRAPEPMLVAAVLVEVLAGLFLSGVLFWLLARRFARVPFGEMQAVIAASGFLNYLPLKPGFVGRIAYLRGRHGVRVSDSIRMIVEALALTATSAVASTLALLALRAAGLDGGWSLLVCVVPALLALQRRGRTMLLALAVRQAEFSLWIARYWIVFRLVGAPIGLDTAVVLAAISVVSSLIPFISNGLGVREWAVGLLAPLITGDAVGATQAIVAELAHRVLEIAVVAPLGLVGLLACIKSARAHGSSRPHAT